LDGQGFVLYAKWLEKGGPVWPQTHSSTVTPTNVQLSMLLAGIDCRMLAWTARTEVAAGHGASLAPLTPVRRSRCC
jgi:transposase